MDLELVLMPENMLKGDGCVHYNALDLGLHGFLHRQGHAVLRSIHFKPLIRAHLR
jgi:hypothetical protein